MPEDFDFFFIEPTLFEKNTIRYGCHAHIMEQSGHADFHLFAVFKARPSPFYIMDEVEADGSFDAVALSADLNRWFIDHFHTHDAKLHRAL